MVSSSPKMCIGTVKGIFSRLDIRIGISKKDSPSAIFNGVEQANVARIRLERVKKHCTNTNSTDDCAQCSGNGTADGERLNHANEPFRYKLTIRKTKVTFAV